MVDRGIGGSPLDVLRAPEAIGTAAGTSNTLQTVQKKNPLLCLKKIESGSPLQLLSNI